MEVNKGEQAIKVLPLLSQEGKESSLTQADSQSHLQYLSLQPYNMMGDHSTGIICVSCQPPAIK